MTGLFPQPDSLQTSQTIRLLPETSDTGPSGLTRNFPDPPSTTRFLAKVHSGDCARPFYEGENVVRRDKISNDMHIYVLPTHKLLITLHIYIK